MASAIQTDTIAALVVQCGDNLRGECAQFSRTDWTFEVINGDTVLGYWEWVYSQAEANDMDPDSLTPKV